MGFDITLSNEQKPVCIVFHGPDIMCDYRYADAGLRSPPKNFHQAGGLFHIECGGRFVEQQITRASISTFGLAECFGEKDALALSSGQGIDVTLCQMTGIDA